MVITKSEDAVEYKALQFKAEDIDAEKRIISGYASTYDLDQIGRASCREREEIAGLPEVLSQRRIKK